MFKYLLNTAAISGGPMSLGWGFGREGETSINYSLHST
jgi:hypothetical protein